MAYDKVVDSARLSSDMTSVANALRSKSGVTGMLSFPAGFLSAIASITSGAGGGTPIQSGVFTPASQDAKHTITVEDSIAANPFVCIFSVDEEQTPSNLSIVQGVFFVPDPTASLSNVNQWELHSGSSNFISALTRSMTAGTWTASTKKLVLSARGGANFYTAQYSYMIVPLTGLASVWR